MSTFAEVSLSTKVSPTKWRLARTPHPAPCPPPAYGFHIRLPSPVWLSPPRSDVGQTLWGSAPRLCRLLLCTGLTLQLWTQSSRGFVWTYITFRLLYHRAIWDTHAYTKVCVCVCVCVGEHICSCTLAPSHSWSSFDSHLTLTFPSVMFYRESKCYLLLSLSE